MIINFNCLNKQIFNLKDDVISSISPLHKKIFVIACLALSSIAAIYLCCKYFFPVKPGPKDLTHENKETKRADNSIPDNRSVGVKPSEKPPVETPPIADKREEHPQLQDKKQVEDINNHEDAPTPIEENHQKIVQQEEPVEASAPKSSQREENPDETATKQMQEEVAQSPDPVSTQKEDPTVIAAKKAQEEEEAKANAEAARAKAAADRKVQKIVNVLLVGRSRAGKSTLMEMLQNPFYIPPEMSFYFSTTQPKRTEIKLNDYTFRVLDTPGLFEIAASNSLINARSNEEIAELIEAKVSDVFGGQAYGNVDAVIFANSLPDGVKAQDIESIQFFVPRVGAHSKKLFVVTRSECLTDDMIENLRNQCAQHVPMGQLIQDEFGGKEKILFTGALSTNYLTFKDLANSRLLRVIELRERLVDALLADALTPQERKEFHSQELDGFNLQYPKFLENIPDQPKGLTVK